MENILSKSNFVAEKWVGILLPLTLFILPISSSGKSILICLSLLAIILTPEYRQDIKSILTASYVVFPLALFFIVLLGCLWSPAVLKQQAFVVEKYSKFLYLPFLIVGFQSTRTRNWGLKAFILAMCFICLLSIVKYYGFLQAFDFNPDNIFRNHIMTGIMVAFAAYLSALFISNSSGFARIHYVLAVSLLSYQLLFINAGRTGYVIYFLLIFLLLIQIGNWKKMIVGLLLVASVFVLSYLTSNVMQTRVNGAYQQLLDYKQNKKDTDIGMRLQFHAFAYHLFQRHPIIGNGTGSFTYYFAQEKPIPAWDRKLLEPHSQYWLVASELGLLGITVLFIVFLSLFSAARKLLVMQPVAIAILSTFILGNLSDSLLFYSGTGYLFILIMSLCLGELFTLQYKSGEY
jgi:O-antigen ligase